MPSSVISLLRAADLVLHFSTSWGVPPSLDRPGVYVVTTSASSTAPDVPAPCALSEARVLELLHARPELTVHGRRPTAEALSLALRAMWVDGETVAYVGLASQSVRSRVMQYYATPLGARSPHAGGWPIKTLAALNSLHVHVASSGDPDGAERAMLEAFMASTFPAARAALSDPDLPLPFANLQLDQGVRKRHGIRGARAPRVREGHARAASQPGDAPRAAQATVAPSRETVGSEALSLALNVTAADLAGGRVRITRDPKRLLGLPRTPTTVTVYLRGVALQVAWDPKLGPDKERSGVLRVPASHLHRLLGGPVTLRIRRDEDGSLRLD